MDFNEHLVKEYLESKGYFVRTNIKSARKEIDILAVDPSKEKYLVGEVKSARLNAEGLKEINHNIFENSFILEKISSLFPGKVYEKVIFCWNFNAEDQGLIKLAKYKYNISLITYGIILKHFHSKIIILPEGKYRYDNNRPTFMLFQMLYEFSNNFEKSRFQ